VEQVSLDGERCVAKCKEGEALRNNDMCLPCKQQFKLAKNADDKKECVPRCKDKNAFYNTETTKCVLCLETCADFTRCQPNGKCGAIDFNFNEKDHSPDS